jgi:hypothetical protein
MHKSILGFLFIILGAVSSAFAQGGTGQLSGNVADANGAVVAGASVKLTSLVTAQVREATTNDAGDFVFTLLLLLANLVLLALSLVWLGPAAADVHDIAGPELRGLGIGVYFFAVIIAYGIGSLIIGQLNDWLGATSAPLNMRYSMLLCPLACLVAAFSLWQGCRAANRLER